MFIKLHYILQFKVISESNLSKTKIFSLICVKLDKIIFYFCRVRLGIAIGTGHWYPLLIYTN